MESNLESEKNKEYDITINPKELKLKQTISNNVTNSYGLCHSFTCFNTIDGKSLLVYGTKFLIECYDLIKNKIIKTIEAHMTIITSSRYCYDIINNKDLLISSSHDNTIKYMILIIILIIF